MKNYTKTEQSPQQGQRSQVPRTPNKVRFSGAWVQDPRGTHSILEMAGSPIPDPLQHCAQSDGNNPTAEYLYPPSSNVPCTVLTQHGETKVNPC